MATATTIGVATNPTTASITHGYWHRHNHGHCTPHWWESDVCADAANGRVVADDVDVVGRGGEMVVMVVEVMVLA